MSSSDDEFYDAQDILSRSSLTWSDKDDAKERSHTEDVEMNAQRRFKVESLKRSLERGEDPGSVIGGVSTSLVGPGSRSSRHSSKEVLSSSPARGPTLGATEEIIGMSEAELNLSQDCMRFIKTLTLERSEIDAYKDGGGPQQATDVDKSEISSTPSQQIQTSVATDVGTSITSGLSYDDVIRSTTANQPREVTSHPGTSSTSSHVRLSKTQAAVHSERSPTSSLHRPRTISGRALTDEEILALTSIRNLDTGESFPLSSATSPADLLNSPLNPLDLQMLQRSQQQAAGATSSQSIGARSTEGSEVGQGPPGINGGVTGPGQTGSLEAGTGGSIKRRSGLNLGHRIHSARLTQFYNRTRQVVKNVATRASEVLVPDDYSSDEEEQVGNYGIRLRASRSKKGRKEFFQIKVIQEMQQKHVGAVWTMKFSPCGRLLATGGQDKTVRIWVLKPFYRYFKAMQKRMQEQLPTMSGPVPDNEDLFANLDSVSLDQMSSASGKTDDDGSSSAEEDLNNSRSAPFRVSALLVYRGHDGAVLDIAWSRNFFLLSSSMDRHVRLWHITRRETLCCFSHTDFVTAIVFHPKDDRYFLSGSMDGKLRLWNIPDKKVAHWVDPPAPPTPPGISASAAGRTAGHQKCLITCANFCMEGGQRAVVGTYDGRVIFYTSDKLDYITSVSVKSGSRTNRMCKITGIEVVPGEENKILVTSNDSRIRLYDLRDYHTLCKYRGHVNCSSQIKASFSHTGKYIICGSENHFFYIWRTNHGYHRVSRFSRVRKDRNNFWEAIKAHEAVVTVAIFSPGPNLILDRKWRRRRRHSYSDYNASPSSSLNRQQYMGEVVVSADFNGCIRVFKNRMEENT